MHGRCEEFDEITEHGYAAELAIFVGPSQIIASPESLVIRRRNNLRCTALVLIDQDNLIGSQVAEQSTIMGTKDQLSSVGVASLVREETDEESTEVRVQAGIEFVDDESLARAENREKFCEASEEDVCAPAFVLRRQIPRIAEAPVAQVNLLELGVLGLPLDFVGLEFGEEFRLEDRLRWAHG